MLMVNILQINIVKYVPTFYHIFLKINFTERGTKDTIGTIF